MNKRYTALGIIPLLFLLSACFAADTALFPNSAWKPYALASPGYYMAYPIKYDGDAYTMAGRGEPVILRRDGARYSLMEASAFEFDTAGSQDFTIFSSQSGVTAEKLITQTEKQLVFGGKRTVFVYNRMDIYKSGQIVSYREDCADNASGVAKLQSRGFKLQKHSEACILDSAQAVEQAVLDLDSFTSYSSVNYYPVPAERIKTFAEIGGTLSPRCTKVEPLQAYEPVMDGKPAPAETHWRILSHTDRPTATVENGFAVEAKGNKQTGWAMVGMWDKETKHLKCGAALYFRVDAFMPDEDAISLPTEVAAATKTCQDYGLSSSACNSHEAMINRFVKSGLKIMAQGTELRGMPDGKYMYGNTVTLLAVNGVAPEIVALETRPNGATTIAWRYPGG